MDAMTMLCSLPREYRQVLVLREVERRSYDEIAGLLGLSRDSVACRLTRARRELMKQLEMRDNFSRRAVPGMGAGDPEVRA